MSKGLSVVVSGATGAQGGAVTRRLLERGHRVRGLTRRPDAPPAKRLAELGVEVIAGHLEDKGALRRALDGADAFFVVTSFFEDGFEAEVRQGRTAADIAKEAELKHFVFSSVAQCNTGTKIPHVDTKWEIEKYMATLDLPATIVAPVWFMENLFAPWLPGLKEGKFAMALPANRRHQQVAISDLAALAVLAMEQPQRFIGRRIDVASDQLTGAEAASLLSGAMLRDVRFEEVPVSEIRKGGDEMGEDFATMYEWFNKVGYAVNVAALKADCPEVPWHTFETWAWSQNLRHAEAEQ